MCRLFVDFFQPIEKNYIQYETKKIRKACSRTLHPMDANLN